MSVIQIFFINSSGHVRQHPSYEFECELKIVD